jgi:hypothetical protein
MGLFGRLFGTREARMAKRLLKDARGMVDATYGPANKLGLEIVAAASSTQQSLGRVFECGTGGPPSEPQMLTLYEFLYFFSHLALRTAVAKGFSDAQIGKLQGFLGPLLASCAVDSFCREWPEKLKARIRSEFYEKLNHAEIEYGECRGLVSEDEPLNRNTLVGRLANNVADLWERPSDDVAKLAVVSAALEAFTAAKLDELVAEVAATIDRWDSKSTQALWSHEP